MISTEPTHMQLKEIKTAPSASPFDMVNLLKYRPMALNESAIENTEGRTGRDAYNEYGKTVLPKIIELGGCLVYRGVCDHLFVGDESQNYDEVIIVRYPSRKAYIDMFSSPEYQSAIMHRKAGLEFRVLHECTPAQ